ncbi:MAG TPA: hypothetical protein PK024_10295 [Methanospirillum sp.]|jgi:glutamate synthase domain-containing protein 1|uniref:hypothetical protein n=1 Tax=Methanospirillum sp. TaxID=45200 RepID=UPI002C138998|nr:hypothetical protein [Methanospirillum sp.]HOJ97209.1 hypothetical protein [Methanospirillum sp.]HOL41922.1 hypothetical protein [Methanospirillum sp.]HPP78241.1 hypothetical protein [Methanospirillum sp.]
MNTSVPKGPDPKEKGAVFLGWLKKRGGLRSAADCRRKCTENGFEAKWFIKEMGEERIALYFSRGNKVIVLKDMVWADQWMMHYNLEVPHHRHWIDL